MTLEVRAEWVKISDLYDDEDRTIEILGVKLHWPFPIAFMLHGSGATVFGYRAYGGGKRPIITALRKAFEAISNAKYELLYRFSKPHQYHVIYTDLPPAYHCSDARILYGAMKCLCEYVEAGKHDGEKGLEEHVAEMRAHPDPNAPDGLVESCVGMESEALAIYRWWKYTKPVEEKREREQLMFVFGNKPEFKNLPPEEKKRLHDEFRALEAKIIEDEQTYLHRLIEIRRGLWV